MLHNNLNVRFWMNLIRLTKQGSPRAGGPFCVMMEMCSSRLEEEWNIHILTHKLCLILLWQVSDPYHAIQGHTKQAALDFSAICLPLTQLISHSNPLPRITCYSRFSLGAVVTERTSELPRYVVEVPSHNCSNKHQLRRGHITTQLTWSFGVRAYL